SALFEILRGDAHQPLMQPQYVDSELTSQTKRRMQQVDQAQLNEDFPSDQQSASYDNCHQIYPPQFDQGYFQPSRYLSKYVKDKNSISLTSLINNQTKTNLKLNRKF